MENLSHSIPCCNLISFLGKVNQELGSEKLETEEFIKIIYCFLEKKEYLCSKCN